MITRPHRSALYIPASKERALRKARALPVDVVLFDLEDAVAPDAKAAARATLGKELKTGGFAPRMRVVRINALDTDWGTADAAAVAGMECDAVLLPKVNGPQDIEALARLLPDLPIWAMMETPQGVLSAAAIAAHPRVRGFVLGTNDLAKDLGAQMGPERAELQAALQTCLLAARAFGLAAIDGVHNAYLDEDGLRRECVQGRAMGFDGKSLIHPAQIAIANAVFAPTLEEITLARRQIAAYEKIEAQGQAVAVVDGRIVENLHVIAARATLAKAKAIAELETGATTSAEMGA